MMPSLILALSLLAGLQAPIQEPATPQEQAQSSPLDRVIVIGASVSDGFGLEQKHEVGARTTLADVVDAALIAEHKRALDQTTTWMFVNTVTNGRQIVVQAQDRNPTLLVALDFLFWYGYGKLGSESARFSLLEKGLKELESFTCPILVGDFPDMTPALQGKSMLPGGAAAITKEQIPSPESLTKLNQRLAEWAKDRPNIVVVPLSEFLGKLRAKEEITFRGNSWPAGSASTLLQPDLLHPTLRGSVALSLFALDRFVTSHPEIPAESIEWDAETIRSRVYASKEKERLAAAERERKRLEKEKPPPEPPPDLGGKETRKRRAEDGERQLAPVGG